MKLICANTQCGKRFLPHTTWARFCSTSCRVKVWAKRTSCDFCSKRSTHTAQKEIGFGLEIILAKVCNTHKHKLENKP